MARLPNVPTVWSNVFTAWVLAQWSVHADDLWNLGNAGKMWSGVSPFPWSGVYLWNEVKWVLLGATLIYAGGAIFSEMCDVKFDRKYRPDRPLPSGRIPRWLAAVVGLVFCLVGGGFMLIASDHDRFPEFDPLEAANFWQVAILLGAVLSYAVLHKRSPWLAVPLMGLCRPMVVLACLYAWQPTEFESGVPGTFEPSELFWCYTVTLGLYVGGISWVALGEAKVWRRRAVGIMLAGLPLVDAAFVLDNIGISWALTPLGCMALAIGLRKVAAAT
jgi:4-hydroxybenzoate polyprenyltransferase